jgi:hypothetical protein
MRQARLASSRVTTRCDSEESLGVTQHPSEEGRRTAEPNTGPGSGLERALPSTSSPQPEPRRTAERDTPEQARIRDEVLDLWAEAILTEIVAELGGDGYVPPGSKP